MPPAPRLYLITPAVDDAEAFRPVLAAACREGDVAAVLLRLPPADDRTLVNRVKALAPAVHGVDAALVLADDLAFDAPTTAARGGADGVHAAAPGRLAALRGRLKDGRSLGAGGLRTRHDAMEAGEAGADYLLFGEPRPDGSVPALAGTAERAEWWASIFEPPCAAYAARLDDAPALAATGAEFVALGDAVWTHPDGPAAAVAAAAAALADGARA